MTYRRIILGVLAALACTVPTAATAQAEAYPSRAITLILPGAAGTGVDVVARAAAQQLGDVLNQRVIVENVVGASGVIGVQRVARARPDGYTLLFTFNQPMTMNPHVVSNLPYDVEKNFVPISRFAQSPFVWMVNSEVPVKDIRELVAYAKANPKKLAVAVTGFGAAGHLGMQLLSHQTGAEFLAVNYSGNTQPDLLANVVQLSMAPAASAASLLRTGKVRALAQTGAKRHPSLPDIPTVAEFLPGYTIDAWYGIWAPHGTPKSIVDQLTAAWIKVAALPEMAERLSAISATPVGSSADELAEVTRRETAMWGEVVKARGIKPVQ